ncbi:MAG: hypothetical protein ACI9YB_003192, partial [Halioglobus sp.]
PGYPAGKLPPVACSVVKVKEINPPESTDPIEWVLICSTQVTSFNQAMVCILQYASRWIIEEFHKALKTGLKAEELQLENADRLFAAISIKSILALRLIDLREKVQLNPEASADESDLSDLELKVLSVYLKRNLVTLRDVSLAIGRLGGHLNRKGDGLPGILTLWKGMTRLNELVVGA